MKQTHTRGFTLIELMIVVAIVAILGALAYPAYTSSVLKGKRAQARTALAELLQQQERYMTQRNCYSGFTNVSGTVTASAPSPSTACGGVTASSVPFKTFSGDNPTNAAYLLSADTCPSGVGAGTLSIAECVRVIALPIGTDPAVGALRMTSTGTKDCTASGSAANSAAITPNPTTLCWP